MTIKFDTPINMNVSVPQRKAVTHAKIVNFSVSAPPRSYGPKTVTIEWVCIEKQPANDRDDILSREVLTLVGAEASAIFKESVNGNLRDELYRVLLKHINQAGKLAAGTVEQ